MQSGEPTHSQSTDKARRSIEAFVVRARRVKAHSLVQSGEIDRLANPSFTALFESDGTTTVRLNSRPHDEELFESLAARVRPCTIGDPVNIKRVISSLRILANGQFTEKQIGYLDSISTWYESHIDEGKYLRCYEQICSVDNPTRPTSATDVTLAMGWFYNDLVHASPNSKRKVALEFPYDSRYNNGVVLVSCLAKVIVSLLDFIREAYASGTIRISESAWLEQVTAGSGPLDYRNVSVSIGPAQIDVPEDKPVDEVEGMETLTPVRAAQIRHPNQCADLFFLESDNCIGKRYRGIYTATDRDVSINIEDIAILTYSLTEDDSTSNVDLPLGTTGIYQIYPVNGKEDSCANLVSEMEHAQSFVLVLTYGDKHVPLVLKANTP